LINPGIAESLAPSIMRAEKRVLIRFGTTQLTKKTRPRRAVYSYFPQASNAYGKWVFPLAANAVWPVEKVVTVTKSGFCILIDGDDDGLDVLVAPTLQGRVTPGLRQRFIHGGLSAFSS
jgi:hypothetical protein